MRVRLATCSVPTRAVPAPSLTLCSRTSYQRSYLKGQNFFSFKLTLTAILDSSHNFCRYVHLHNEVQLDSIPGMVFCPRTSCGSRVLSEPDSDLAMCPQCAFPFCKLCRQTWHGPGICPALEKVGIPNHTLWLTNNYALTT